MAELANFHVVWFPKVVVLHKIGEVEKWNTYSIAYRLCNNCTKNYYNRIIGQLIFELCSNK